MIPYDINSFPSGLDPSIWNQLIEKGILIYDSKTGLVPFKIGDDNISLIDINNMSMTDINEIINFIKGINENINSGTEEQNKIIKENNEKLIRYLKDINAGSVAG